MRRVDRRADPREAISPLKLSHPTCVAEASFDRKRALGTSESARPHDLDQSKIKTAEAITVVHKPRLSPTADCVTLAVRTILLEMR